MFWIVNKFIVKEVCEYSEMEGYYENMWRLG